MTRKFEELSRDEQFYVRSRADALGVRVEFIDCDAILEHYKPPESAFDREYRSNEIISADRRKRAEAAPAYPLPSESEVKDFARRFGVVPELVPTAEKRAAEELAERQRQDYETAAEAKSTYDLVQIGNDKNHPHWEAARQKVAEYFPSFDGWD